MSYGKHFYLLPGDILKSKQENFNFHRDMTYEVSKCFQLNGNIIIYVKNKWGKDARYIPENFEYTVKTATACEKRRKECTLINFWLHSDDSYELWLGWDNSVEPSIKKFIDYKLENHCHFVMNPDAIARIIKKPYNSSEEHIFIFNEKEYFDYFYKEISDDDWDYSFRMKGISKDTQDSIDQLIFISRENFPIFDKSLINESEYKDSTWFRLPKYKDFFFFLEDLNKLIFDDAPIHRGLCQQKDCIYDTISLFRDLPSSHSGTSISKILYGNSKNNTVVTKPYLGKYKSLLKQPQLYELASHIEHYLFNEGIFKTKEEYASDKNGEWRGAFEFIGSKYIDKEKLEEILKMLK